MNTTYTPLHNPLVQGIKVIGIGKHGSKPLPTAQVEEIFVYLSSDRTNPIQRGAFFGSLMAKGPTPEEQQLLQGSSQGSLSVEEIYDSLCADAPASMRPLGLKLLRKEFLAVEEARTLGDFLFSDLPGEALRGLAASMLRMRYETDEEYQGLMAAAINTYSPEFSTFAPAGAPVVQLAEPFDGVEHSYMMTPLLAQAIQKAGYPVVVSMGRSSGPKLSLNTLDIYQAMGAQRLKRSDDLLLPTPPMGWALEQHLLSPVLDKWVERRRLIFKRPFLATLEKVLNPCKARVLITSVFHITYIEKMITLAGMAGFAGVIILKRGLEGTLAPSIAKASGITCAARQSDGSFRVQSFETAQEDFAAFRGEADEHVQNLNLADNIALIQQFAVQGLTENDDFNKRAHLMVALYQKGLDWIMHNLA